MITEDLSLYFADFGVPVVWQRGVGDVVESQGLLDMPDEINEGTMSINTAFAVTVQTSIFAGIEEGAELTVDGQEYTLSLAPIKLQDGKLCVLGLSPND